MSKTYVCKTSRDSHEYIYVSFELFQMLVLDLREYWPFLVTRSHFRQSLPFIWNIHGHKRHTTTCIFHCICNVRISILHWHWLVIATDTASHLWICVTST